MFVFTLIMFQRWVWAYRQERVLVSVNTNNGIERRMNPSNICTLKTATKVALVE